MAENIISGLFGVSPDELNAQRQAKLQNEAFQYAQLDPFQRANMGIYQGAGQLAGQGARMLGMVDPQEESYKQGLNIASQVDMTTPEGILKAADMAKQQGNTKMQIQLQMLARQKQVEQSKLNLEAAQAHKALQPTVTTSPEGVPGRPGWIRQVSKNPDGTVVWEGEPYPQSSNIVNVNGGSGKPLPIGVFKQKGDLEDALNTSTQIGYDVEEWASRIKSGKLKLSLLDNIGGKLSVKAGIGGAEAVELANFATFIEQLRNDRMLLAKGTQTEGDAQRELNGIVSSISDPNYVSERLRVIANNSKEKARKTELQLGGLNKQYKFEGYDVNDYKAKSSVYKSADSTSGSELPHGFTKF